MAALIRHGSFTSAFKSTSAILVASTVTARRGITRHKNQKKPMMMVKARIDSAGESLAARGFLRSQKSYEPPENAAERIDRICECQTVPVNDDTKLEDPVLRFKLFIACEREFKHSIPNSLLYTIESIEDLKQFYSTPVDSTTPYEALRRIDLPKNLHIQQDYHRFHPDTDTMFNGQTAFPKSSTIVTGLKYKKKYPGHTQDNPWLDEQMKI
ncbi:PREDICTED: 39S ribosomal protein L50, mitochondrial isoform X2 [Trachymyrmex septentrionalis]|uniref:39S ribosomal protein L50, mitochondrial isoform X2 n=1 Tax=Trachymyrmex septentrionalis TaxID=34720 RepID=UPI00084F3716|nr:PREDICTED: 39S ribosomal protein L50, mitochondrial isoform X2 [Trachymyrmex septentrionalis]